MNSDIFQELLDELDGNSLQTLKEKNARYAQNGDCLHNFRSGAEVAGGTPAQACWGYVTKHLVALRDMVTKDDFSNREDFLEKCQDTINYIRFLWCIGNDETGVEDDDENEPDGEVIMCREIEVRHRFGERLVGLYVKEQHPNLRIIYVDDGFKIAFERDGKTKRIEYDCDNYYAKCKFEKEM